MIGATALHKAADGPGNDKNRLLLVRTPLEKGSDPFAADFWACPARSVPKIQGRTQISKILTAAIDTDIISLPTASDSSLCDKVGSPKNGSDETENEKNETEKQTDETSVDPAENTIET